jgi:mono/diheme cytochrome c family protein
MRPASVNAALLRAVLTCVCVTFALGAGRATQARARSDGWQIPDDAAAEHNPVLVDPTVLANGRALYKSKCQRCHGVNGKGDGPEADANHPPSDLTDLLRASRNPDGVMFYKIWNGRTKPKMPAFKTDISRTEVWTVIHYVKSLRRKDTHAERLHAEELK